jgi:Ca2+/H+ antiporter
MRAALLGLVLGFSLGIAGIRFDEWEFWAISIPVTIVALSFRTTDY